MVKKLQRPAYFHALAITGSHEDAADASQQAFIRAWRSRESVEAEKPFYAWFYTILKRLCLNVLRDRNRGRETVFSRIEAWIEPAGGEDASAGLLRDENRRLLQQALARLSPDDREIIALKDLSGYAYRDIAAVLEIPEGTVMSRLYTARKRLKSEMEKAGYEYA